MEPFRIEGIELNEIGPFKNIKLDFPPKTDPEKAEIHILTGENGTGKSTLLEAIVEPINKYLTSESIIEKKIWSNNVGKGYFILKYPDGEYKSSQPQGVDGSPIHPNFLLELCLMYGRSKHSIFDHILLAYSGYRRVINYNIQGIQELQNSPLENSTNFSYSIDPQQLLQWIANVKTRELIARGKGNQEKAEEYRGTLQVMEQALSRIVDSEIEFDLEENPLGVLIRVDGQPLNFDQLPDGLRSMVSWLGDLLMRMDRLKWENDTPILQRNFILLLDEIEVHLHPAWQRKILPVVQTLFPNAQLFISTHSPFVVGSVDGAWVHRFVKKDGHSVLSGPPVLSEDSNSYDYILEEIFGVKERFGVEVERKLDNFRKIKQQILAHEAYNRDAFDSLIRELSTQSAELESIVGLELKQLKRITNQDFAISES